MDNNILVLGSTGKTGSRVYALLKEKGYKATPASRSSSIPFDWYRSDTWSAALAGMHTVYVTFQPDLAVPEALPILTDFIAASKAAGITKLVLLSGRGEPEAAACENVVISSGLNYTILRCSFFMQNFSEGVWAEGIAVGELILPAVSVAEPFIDADDIALAAVAALTESRHDRCTYELTGPELLTFDVAIGKIAARLGKQVVFQQIGINEYTDAMRGLVPEELINLIRYLFEEVLDGRNESTTPDLERVIGRKPRSFDEFADKAVESGVWSVQMQAK